MRRRIVVLDTNVSATALTGYHRIPRAAVDSTSVRSLEAGHAGDIVLKVSTSMLAELDRVLQYPAFGYSSHIAQQYVRFYRQCAKLVHVPGTLRILKRDPDDNTVLECAVVGKADFLVTWNIGDFAELAKPDMPLKYRGVEIVRPPDLIRRLTDEGWLT